jgi:hypothetical protein
MTDVAVARLQLFVSQAVLNDTAADSIRVMLLPGRQLLTLDAASRALANVPKPTICSTRAASDRLMIIVCNPVTTSDDVATYNMVLAANSGILEAAAQASGPDSGEQVFTVESGSRSMRVSKAVITQWFTEYCSGDNLAISHGAGGSNEYIIRIHRVLPLDFDTLPPDMVDLIPPWLLPPGGQRR